MSGLLIDTQAFLWLIAGNRRLSATAAEAIAESDSAYLSTASAWEIAIKSAKGKLRLAAPPERFVPAQLRTNRIQPLPVGLGHALAVHDLPHHHGDPFDRMLVAQAQVEGLTLVTDDTQLRSYEVPTLW